MSEVFLRGRCAVPASAIGAVIAMLAAPASAQSNEQAAAWAANPARARVEALLANVPQPQHGGGNGAEVVDGKPAKPGKWPFMVALVIKSNPSNYTARFCGGSLIDDNHVLTAAHCVLGVVDQGIEIQALVGTHSLLEGGRRVDVTRITLHPDFAATPFLQADVAVLRLGAAVTDIAPVAYAASKVADDAVSPDNGRTTVMSWGALEWNKPGPFVLYQARLKRNTVAECNALDHYSGRLTEDNVCAGDLREPGKSPCYGDSGGPLVGKDDDGATVQIGVVSGGSQVCGDMPSYFARVGSYAPWINDQVTAP